MNSPFPAPLKGDVNLTMKLLVSLLFVLPFTLAAEDGKVLYTTYCSACHGVDGVGPENNVNPPLAKSEWLTGSPDRAISSVMVGLVGPIEVTGKPYNLQMPPQGAVLNDEQLAAILTHVRKSWGNKQKPVQPEQVARVRAKLKERKTPYTANELRKEYPIPYRPGWPRLENLTSHVYHGKWELMPDFSQLKPVSVEEEPRNLVDVAHADRDKEFGIVWEGDLVTAKEGDYNAMLDASDGAVLLINDSKIVEVEGVGPRGSERARIYRFRMLKGQNKFRLEYFNNQGNPGLSFQMTGPTGAPWLSESRLKIQPAAPAIPLVAEEGSAVIYRNFIEGARARAIGVGYDGGVNQAFSVTHMGPDVIWQGKFLDGGLHWTNRGKGNQKPSGIDIVQLLTKPAYAVLSNEKAPWPNRNVERIQPKFGGYALDEKGLPTFRYEVEGVKVTEYFVPVKGLPHRSMDRTITFTANDKVPGNLHLALVTGPKIEVVDSGFLLDGKVAMRTQSNGELFPILRKDKDSLLVVPLTLKKGITTLTVTYSWNQ